MKVPRFITFLLGEDPEQVRRMHRSSRERLRAIGFSLPLPSLAWTATGYGAARVVWGQGALTSTAVGATCGAAVLLIELVVAAAPKHWTVAVGRVGIGIVMATLGAIVIDLLAYRTETDTQLLANAQVKIEQQYARDSAALLKVVETLEKAWTDLKAKAACEWVSGCVSGVRGRGPTYDDLSEKAAFAKGKHGKAVEDQVALARKRDEALVKLESPEVALKQFGLLDRAEALSDVAKARPFAQFLWGLSTLFLIWVECFVLFAKYGGGRTPDEEAEQAKEELTRIVISQRLLAARSTYAPVYEYLDAPGRHHV